MNAAQTSTFSPGAFLASERLPAGTAPPALLILDQPIASFDVFARLWRHTDYRICADGGANRLYDMFEGPLESQRGNYLPDSIHGDLDSLRDDVRAYYASLGVDVSQDGNQYNTDFGKAMQKMSSTRPSPSAREVLILGTLGGRVDHGLGMLHDMIREESRDQMLRLWLFSESSISFILKGGHSIVEGLMSSKLFTKNVGLIPIYGPATITTSGLEWDVNDWDTQMGTQVSSSNHVMAEIVHVRTSAPILFTIERCPYQEITARVKEQTM